MVKHFFIILLLLIPLLNKAGYIPPVSAKEAQNDLYSALNLSQKGLSAEVLEFALQGLRRLEAGGKLRNPGILTIIDFSQSSKNKRLYVIDLLHKALLFNTYVAHGRNTGEEFASHFSNVSGSCKSSLGFYITQKQIMGSTVGLALMLEGVEKGFNDNAVNREIVMHGAQYATENFIKKTGRLGRSFGCPSLPPAMIKPVLETIKEGSCLFIYQNDKLYLSHSALLNQHN